jgi:glutamine synthetase
LLSDAKSPGLARLELGSEILSVQALEQHGSFFSDLYAACTDMDIAADAASSEAAPGQYEVNLSHGPALKAADDAWLFKMAARGIARKHGSTATFMAKPLPDQSGNGLHVHFSVLERNGRNIFDNGGPDGTDLLRHAVAGCLDHMQASTLIFAPHANSYERLEPNTHAPTTVSWGYDNRTASVRIPAGPKAARRIEHRVAGGDANPYLLLAAILGAALRGIKGQSTPPAPVIGNAYEGARQTLPAHWSDAIDRFAASPDIKAIFAPKLVENLVSSKRQDQKRLAEIEPGEIAQFYLDRA